MANHSPEPNNYVARKTWDDAMADNAPSVKPEGTASTFPEEIKRDTDATKTEETKRTTHKGAAAKNGGE